jgi:hypothetical protein
MNTNKITHWLTFAANIGVILGILLLVFELQQNRDLMKAQMRTEISNGIYDLFTLTAVNPQLADLLYRAEKGEKLTPAEHFQYMSRTKAMFRYFENVNYQYRQGLYEESEYDKQKAAWKNYLNNSKIAVSIWCDYRTSVSDGLMSEIDSLLDKNKCIP